MLQRFEDRPHNLQEVCLVYFAAPYNVHTFQKRRDLAVISYHCYFVDKSLSYKREAVALILTFGRKVDILDGNAFQNM